MSKIKNPHVTCASVLQWTVLPKSTKAVNQITGEDVEELPKDVADSPQVAALVDRGILDLLVAKKIEAKTADVPSEAPAVAEQTVAAPTTSKAGKKGK